MKWLNFNFSRVLKPMARLKRIMEHALKSEKILLNMIRDATKLKHIHRNFCEIIANPIVVKARAGEAIFMRLIVSSTDHNSPHQTSCARLITRNCQLKRLAKHCENKAIFFLCCWR